MAKQLVFGEEARRSLKKGIDALAASVRVTLGPSGPQRNPGQEIWPAHRLQRWRDHSQRDRAGRAL